MISQHYKIAKNNEIEEEDAESLFDILIANFSLDDSGKVN
jgi:hypothetical protein